MDLYGPAPGPQKSMRGQTRAQGHANFWAGPAHGTTMGQAHAQDFIIMFIYFFMCLYLTPLNNMG